MGTGNAKNDNTKVKYLSFQTKDDDNPHFKVVRKNPDNGKYEKTEEITWFDGWLIEVKMGVYTPKDNSPPSPTIIMYFKDGLDLMKLETGFSMMSRTLINALANLPKLGKMKISLYTSSKNDKANIWIECDGEKCDWKYGWEDVQKPKIYEYDKGGGEVGKNYKELNEFFEEVLMKEVNALVYAQKDDATSGAHSDVPDPLLEAVKESQDKSTDIPKHEGESMYNPEAAPPIAKGGETPPVVPVVEEESDDLPF